VELDVIDLPIAARGLPGEDREGGESLEVGERAGLDVQPHARDPSKGCEKALWSGHEPVDEAHWRHLYFTWDGQWHWEGRECGLGRWQFTHRFRPRQTDSPDCTDHCHGPRTCEQIPPTKPQRSSGLTLLCCFSTHSVLLLMPAGLV